MGISAGKTARVMVSAAISKIAPVSTEKGISLRLSGPVTEHGEAISKALVEHQIVRQVRVAMRACFESMQHLAELVVIDRFVDETFAFAVHQN